jgi:hypothetical protein
MANTDTLKESDIAGTCPACGFVVLLSEPDGPVWTCPADLSEGNRFKEYQENEITEEMREKAGVFSNCWEDFGRPCFKPIPLHSACYEKGNY